jgi:hypothetical protein
MPLFGVEMTVLRMKRDVTLDIFWWKLTIITIKGKPSMNKPKTHYASNK